MDKVVEAVMMAKAGLVDDDKPMASLLFVGPTGVGKTEVVRVLAKELGIEIGYIVELVVFILQALQYLDSLLLGRFLDIYLLEASHDALTLSHIAVEFLVVYL